MIDDDQVQSHRTSGPSHFDMDEAFCARMRAAIAAGLETAPVGIITTPGTKNPKYVPTKQKLHAYVWDRASHLESKFATL
jgi:hypothetical protein